MVSLCECRFLNRALTIDDISKKPNCNNLKFKRAFQFLQFLLIQRVYGMDVIQCSGVRKPLKHSQQEQEQEQEQQQNYQVFLGGSCNPTTWRHDQAIPYFQSRSVSFFNPQVTDWTPDLIEIEHRAKELAPLLFFVIDHDTRALASIVEVCYLAARGRSIIVVMNPMPDKNHTKFVQQKTNIHEKDTEDDYENVCKARRTLRTLLQNMSIPVFDDLRLALQCAAYILETTKHTVINHSACNDDNKEDNGQRDPLSPLTMSPNDVNNCRSSSVVVIRSLSNKTTFESSDDFYRQMYQSELPSAPSKLLQRRMSSSSESNRHQYRVTSISTKTQLSCSTNESDDDGYSSLASSNRTLSISSSSLTSELFEATTEQQREENCLGSNNKSPTSMMNNFISNFYSYIPFVRPSTPPDSSVSQSLLVLFTLPFRFIKNTLLSATLPSSSTTIFFPSPEPVILEPPSPISSSSSRLSNYTFDIYIASGENDEYWVNKMVIPAFEKINLTFTKRQSYRDNDQSDSLNDLHVCKQSSVLYYLINGSERLSHLATELAFLIGERKHKIIVYLQSTIDENTEHILSPCERRDIQRSRKYLEDLARKEKITLFHSRHESLQGYYDKRLETMAFTFGTPTSTVDSDDYISSITTMSDRSDEQQQQHLTISDHASRTVSKIASYFRQGFLCDVVFICGHGQLKQRIAAHRLVIATLSDYFRAMFESNMLETKQREIIINDVDPDAFEKLILYAYEGHLDIHQDNVTNVLCAAHMFNIIEIIESCCKYIEKQLHPSNCLGIYKFALQHDLHGLTQTSWNYILEHFTNVIQNNHEFFELSFDEIKQLLTSGDINVQSEEIVFEAFLSWIVYDKKRQTDRLAQLFGLIRLPLIDKKYLTDYIDTNQIFKDDSLCQMLIVETMRYHLAPEKRSSMQSIRTKPRKATLGSLYCLGGMDSAKGPQTIERYDFRTRSWQPDDHLNTRRWQFACVILNKKLYVCGGRDGLKTLNSIEIFDFQKKTWNVGPPMLTNRHGLGVGCIGGPLYAIGGHDGWSFLNTVERFDPETCVWSYVASMANVRCSLGVTVLENRIYAVGGRDGAAGLREAEFYDPHTNRWSPCAPMQKRRGGVAVVACNGFLFAIGGHESSATNKCTVRHDDGERYDTRCDQWTLITSLNRPKEALAIAAVSDKLYIVGGFDGKVLDEVEKYDPEIDKWTKCPSLGTKRAGACLIHVPNSIHQSSLPISSSSSSSFSSLSLLTTSSYTLSSPTSFAKRNKDVSASCHQLSRLVLS
ncbi:unnamed protein product [Rotaria sordida]|uniref:BTB domain-containing protein n=1 Tax=Rotaria sordida TaxID=392033 RepID=A0A813TUJ0_9BILA|nr:unnamed protein product [Rotaria sordida]